MWTGRAVGEASERSAGWIASRDSILRADPEPVIGEPADRAGGVEPEPEGPTLLPVRFPGRLGDPRPELVELSERVAEANRRSRDRYGKAP